MTKWLAVTAVAALLAVSGTASAAPSASTSTGVVDIVTQLGLQGGSAAGTGMILSGGRVLTNNHVIRGATSIRVVDVKSGRSYTASVLGYSVSGDVALLKLSTAKTLTTIPTGNSSTMKVGSRVTAVGNAGGAGGAPRVTTGTITGVGKSIVATDGEGTSEQLTGLLEMNASIQPGESGGPLLSRTGRVIGMITAGSVNVRFESSASLGYAVPINTALSIVKQIASGRSSATVHIGSTAFLGVNITDAPEGGVVVTQVVPGSAAESAGLAANDTITSLNGTAVTATTSLRSIVLSLTPGTTVPIEWTDSTGVAQTGEITPAAGPPQ